MGIKSMGIKHTRAHSPMNCHVMQRTGFSGEHVAQNERAINPLAGTAAGDRFELRMDILLVSLPPTASPETGAAARIKMLAVGARSGLGLRTAQRGAS
jgi:hypothetical protein